MKQKCRNVLKAHNTSNNKHTIKVAACTIQSTMASLHIHAKQEKYQRKITVGAYCWSQQELNCGTNQLSVTVRTSSATPDLLLIQQNSFCWISNRSGVAELVCTQWSMTRCSMKVYHTTSHHTSDNTLPQILSLSLTWTVTVTLTINDTVIPTVG